jgi:hypothetical protein
MDMPIPGMDVYCQKETVIRIWIMS